MSEKNKHNSFESQLLHCKICGTISMTEKSFGQHIKKCHKITKEEYYNKLYNKKDMLTLEPLEYKNPEQYLLSDFNNKRNLNSWLNKADVNTGKTYLQNKLKEYALAKSLKYAPSSVELKTIKQLPTISYFEKFFSGGYLEACYSIGLKNLWKYDNYSTGEKAKLKIRIDTREQSPLNIQGHDTEVFKVECGDYQCLLPERKTFIERKSDSDFLGTLSLNFERFKKEIIRAKKNNINLVVLVERNLDEMIAFDCLPHIYTKASPDFIFHRMRELCREFENIQFVFVDGRNHAVKLMEEIFCKGDESFKYDLQYLYIKKLKNLWLG